MYCDDPTNDRRAASQFACVMKWFFFSEIAYNSAQVIWHISKDLKTPLFFNANALNSSLYVLLMHECMTVAKNIEQFFQSSSIFSQPHLTVETALKNTLTSHLISIPRFSSLFWTILNPLEGKQRRFLSCCARIAKWAARLESFRYAALFISVSTHSSLQNQSVEYAAYAFGYWEFSIIAKNTAEFFEQCVITRISDALSSSIFKRLTQNTYVASTIYSLISP